MKGELNHYNIKNPDGVDKVKYNEGKISYLKDNPRFEEDSLKNQAEWDNSVLESSIDDTKEYKNTMKGKNGNEISSSTPSPAFSSTAASTVSSVGSGLGAVAGTVATSVASALMVVVAFVSSLAINVSLVVASMFCLVFELEITGAQQQDFEKPIYAILENNNGDIREQEIYPDMLYLTFDDLKPGTEYILTIKNEEKVFVKKSYFTATEWEEKGDIFASYERNEVFVNVDINLKEGEFYTVTAKTEKGAVVFSKDDIEPNKDFQFELPEAKSLYFTVSVGSKVYAVTQLEIEQESEIQEYDFANGIWTWTDDNSYATISFPNMRGGAPLVLEAQVRESYYEPTSEAYGYTVYMAVVEYNGEVFTTSKQVVDEGGNYDHNYSPRGFVWDYDENGELIAIGEGVCEDCGDILTIPAEMSRDGDLVIASITYNGTTYTDKHVVIDLTDRENVISDDNCYYLKAYSFVLGNLDSGTSISYDNNANYPYIVKGTADKILNSMIVYNRFITKSNYYIEFNNLDVVADEKENSTILNVQTASDVTIHIAIRGNVSLITNDSHCFNVEKIGNNDITVTFDITLVDNDSSFYCYDELLETMNLYSMCSEANIVFNLNGVQVAPNGEPISQDDETSSYDFSQGTWSWSNDYLTAYISFPGIHGGEPLTYEAFVQEYETPATCEQMGSIVYTASVYVEEADEMFSDEQTVELTPTGHDYGEPVFEWSSNLTGAPTAIATFTCSNDSSHQMVLTADVSESYAQDQTLQYIATVTYNNVTYEDIYEVEPIIEDEEIDLNQGQLYINASGYSRQESGLSNPTEFVSSATNPYLIQNQEIDWCDNIINVYQTDSSIQTADIYIKLKNVTIEAGSWCSLFRIMATNTLNIYLIIEGNVTFVGGSGQQIFSSQGSNSPTVNIIIDQISFGGTFNAEISDGLTYAQSGTINVRYVNN